MVPLAEIVAMVGPEMAKESKDSGGDGGRTMTMEEIKENREIENKNIFIIKFK